MTCLSILWTFILPVLLLVSAVRGILVIGLRSIQRSVIIAVVSACISVAPNVLSVVV